MTQERKVALVTGASRGIGKACALHLARRGMNIVAASRTLKSGEAFEVSATAKESDVAAMPGSLEETAAECEQLGVRAIPVKLDLLERRDVERAVQQTLDTFGRLDVLVNNGRYYGPGQQDLFEETAMEYFDKANEANVMAALHLTQLALPPMKRQGGGVVINLTSSSGYREVAALPGQGGWGLNYSITKAAIGRATAGLAKEFRQYNIAVISLLPGNVVTERRVRESGRFGFSSSTADGLSPEIPGRAAAFLAAHPYVMYFSGREFESLDLCVEHELIDPAELAPNYGPQSWGLPRR